MRRTDSRTRINLAIASRSRVSFELVQRDPDHSSFTGKFLCLG